MNPGILGKGPGFRPTVVMRSPEPVFRLPDSSLAGFDGQSADLARYSAILAALAHESRILALRVLLRVYPASLSIGEIALELSIPPAVLSIHLGLLDGAVELVSAVNAEPRYRANVRLISDLVKLVFPVAAEPAPPPPPGTVPAVIRRLRPPRKRA
jgi:DNA-binding transcriptional ArsR family regulator